MPALLLPFHLSSTAIVAEMSLPLPLQTIRLPDCPVTIAGSLTGSVWQQELRVNGFVIGQQLVAFQSAETLPCRCAVDSAVLLFALQGSIRFETESGASGNLEERQYCLIAGRADNSLLLSLPTGNAHIFQLAFSLRMLQKLGGEALPAFLQQTGETSTGMEVSPYRLSLNTSIQQLLKKVLSVGPKTGAYPILRLNETCLKLLKRFTDDRATYYAQQRWAERKQVSITELAFFLSDHLDVESRQQVTLLACAKRTQLEVSLFQRIFRSQYGLTLSKYLVQQRMQKAFFLLSQAGQLPGAVYGEVGYRNFSSFSRAFTEYFGQLPSEAAAGHK